MSLPCALALGLALVSAAAILRRRIVWKLGRFGDALAPSFLLLLWFCGLHLGQWSRSLAVMGWTAALPLALIAGFGLRTKPRRRSSASWTWLDWYVLLLAGLLVFIFNGEDNLCHYSVISTLLRGNIPPSALNDPNFPLVYHWLFDAAAAFFMRATGARHRLAIGAVSFACLAACLQTLQALSRILFDTEPARQTARLLFAFGFGPVYLRLLEPWSHETKLDFYVNGDMAQPFVETILRRPMGLNWTILLFMLSMALKSDAKKKAFWLLPCAYLLPQASEELCLLGTAGLFAAWLLRGASWRSFAAWTTVLAASLPLSGVARAMLSAGPVAVPHAAPAWPWTLPDRDVALRADGLPLFSWKAAWTMLTEWGPLFFAGLFAGAKDPRRRPLVWIFAVGFFLACALTLRGWNKFDLDRFLFYGTALGFMLCAAPLERLGRPAAWALVALTVAAPVGYAIRSMIFNDADHALSSAPIFRLQRALANVGPKELISTDDEQLAQDLVLAGFLVVAPMPSHWIGLVDKASFAAYVKEKGKDADWVLLPQSDGSRALTSRTAARAR